MKAGRTGFNTEYNENEPTSEQISKLPGVALLEFGTHSCGHCQAAEPAVRDALATHPELLHIRIRDGKGKRLGRRFGVKLWPTLVLLREGKEVARLVRPVRADQVRQLLAQSDAEC